jgi:hypothetical protein
MKRISFLLGAVAVLVSVAMAAQTKPSFSGTWKPVSDAAAGGGFGVSEMTAEHTDKTLSVSAVSQMGAIKTVYNLDGTEAKSPLEFNGNTIDRVTKAAWDGGKLVLTATSNFNGQAFEIKEIWSMAADGTLLVETTRPDFQGGGAPVTTKAVYRKS